MTQLGLRFVRGAIAACLVTALAACGGGGGGTGADNTGGSSKSCSPDTSQSDGNITLSGKITYDRVPHAGDHSLDYSNITKQPARGVTVKAVCGSQTYASGKTNANGKFSLSVPNHSDMQIRVLAQMVQSGTPSWNFSVVDNTQSNAMYTLDGSVFDSGGSNLTRNLNAPSGWTGSSYGDPRSAAPFAILDAVYIAFHKILTVDANAQFPQLTLNWSPDNVPSGSNPSSGQIGTTYYSNGKIYILGAADNDTDEYDDHVLIHEWGHYLEDKFSRSDSIGGSHGGGDKLDIRVAYGEGFGNAWSGIATDDPVYEDSYGSQQSQGFDINVESDTDPTPGWYSETTLQGIIYDLYDSNSDGADTVSLGLQPLFDTWTQDQKNTNAMTSIFPFITYLKARVSGAQQAAIDSLLSTPSNNISQITDIWGSSRGNDGGDSNATPVYKTFSAVPTGGTGVQVCSDKLAGGEYNKLANRQFFHFSVSTSRSYTFDAEVSNGASKTDPDMILHRQGADVARFETDPSSSGSYGSEIGSANLTAGVEYVLEVYDYHNVDQDNSTGGTSCFDVTIN